MDQFDTLIRGAAIGVTIFVCVRLLIAQRLGHKPLAEALPGVAIACNLLVSSSDLTTLVHPVGFALVVAAILAPIALVWTVFEIFYGRPTG